MASVTVENTFLPGSPVWLLQGQIGNVLVATEQPNADGVVTFTGLAAGLYRAQQEQPDGTKTVLVTAKELSAPRPQQRQTSSGSTQTSTSPAEAPAPKYQFVTGARGSQHQSGR